MDATSDGDFCELSACECPVCFFLLENERVPMSLPCGHTLCQVCLDAIVTKTLKENADESLSCPLCRKITRREMVSKNITLKNLIDQLLKKKTTGRNHVLNIPFNEIHMGRSLDRGAFGEVFHGVWRDNEVAVKVFGFGEMSPKALVSFRKEVFVMNSLRHPNVVLMMGACQTPPKLAILMEFVPGGSLYKLLHVDGVSLNVEATCHLGCDMSRGLQYLHSINILHRDMKSKNVLLTASPPSGQAKLCDFGLARVRQESATMTGNVGTVHWTAPEVLSSQRYQFPADIYGLGMILFEMISGKIPFHNLIPVAVMMAVAINKQQPEMPEDCNPHLAAIIKRCSTWNPKERPSVADVLNVLSDLLPKPETPTTDKQTSFDHSDSLGIVFLPVTDTADLGVEEIEFEEYEAPLPISHDHLDNMEQFYHPSPQQHQPQFHHHQSSTRDEYPQAKPFTINYQSRRSNQNFQMGQMHQVFQNHYIETREQERQPQWKARSPDEEMALQLSLEETEINLVRDAELAEQLQMKENSYRTPSDTIPRVVPAPSELQQAVHSFKTQQVTVHPDQIQHPRKSKSLPQAPPQAQPITDTHRSQPSPVTDYDRIRQRKIMKSIEKDGFKVSRSLRPVEPKEKIGVELGHVIDGQPIPLPPPPPPLPHSRADDISGRHKIMENVRSLGMRMYRTLRPVQTVEKRPFRVGRVVDGTNSEKYNFTTQNFIASFNHRILIHVKTKECPPPFPVGKVLQRPPNKGVVVSKMMLHYEAGGAETSKPSAARRQPSRTEVKKEVARLNAAQQSMPMILQEDLCTFDSSELNSVAVKVKQVLPTEKDILQEKLEWLEQQEKEKAKQVEKDIPVPELATEVMKHEQANKKVISAKKNVYSKKFSKTKAREI